MLVARLTDFFPLQGDSEISMTAIDTANNTRADLTAVSQSLRVLDRESKRVILELVAEVSVADGFVDIRENAFLLEVAEAIGADRDLLIDLAGERLAKHRDPESD